MNMEEEILQHISPASMPPEMRRRLLDAMAQEAAETRADAAFAAELEQVLAPAAMPDSLRRHLPVRMLRAEHLLQHPYRLRRVCAAVVLVLLPVVVAALFLPGSEAPAQQAPSASMQRYYANGVRYDTFVLETAERSRLRVRVKCPFPPQLPDDVI